MLRGASLTRSYGLKRTRLKRRRGLKRSGWLRRKSTRRQKPSKSGIEAKKQVRQTPCLVCGRWPVDPHHRTPKSRPQDLPDGLDMDAPDNLTPLCREHHAEYGALMGEPTASHLHREAMLRNARTWLARYPGSELALPQWLVEALEGARMSEHTQKPWTHRGRTITAPNGDKYFGRGPAAAAPEAWGRINAQMEARTAFMVRACNSHSDLLAACEAGHDALDEGCRDCALVDRRGDVDECPIKHCLALPAQDTLRAAIAKAKGE